MSIIHEWKSFGPVFYVIERNSNDPEDEEILSIHQTRHEAELEVARLRREERQKRGAY